VNGTVTLVYSGLCNQQLTCEQDGGSWNAPDSAHGKPWCNITSQCVDGRNLISAVPADPEDPLLISWTKSVIVNGSFGCGGNCNASAPGDRGKDASTAWQNPSGEWQFVTGDTPIVYGSMDFKTWYYVGLGFTNGGKSPQGAGGDCPSFWPLPPVTPGAGPPKNASAGAQPTHVHMTSGGFMTLGWYTPGPPKTVGEFLEADPKTKRKSDHGKYYATKDCAITNLCIYQLTCMSLLFPTRVPQLVACVAEGMRVRTVWDPIGKRRILWGWGVPPLNAESLPREVTWNPELEQLCYAPLTEQAQLRGSALATPAVPLALEARQPVMVGPWEGSVGNQSEVVATFAIGPSVPETMLGMVVMGGGNSATSGTMFFVHYVPPANGAAWPHSVEVGAITNRTAAGADAFTCNAPGVVCANDTLQLTARDTNITLRAFIDNNVAECYWGPQGGENRVAMMIDAPPTAEASVSLVSDGSVSVTALSAWQVQSIWVSKEDMLATPRKKDVNGVGW
jgi:hypothetical protein